MEKIKLTIYRKNDKGKYEYTDVYNDTGVGVRHFIQNYINDLERLKRDVRIKYNYNYTDTMSIDIYYSNGWKYHWENVPCMSSQTVDTYKLFKDYEMEV